MADVITPRAKNYPQWYLDIVKHAAMAENSDVRGCMVIKPNGYAIWEKMQRGLDRLFKDTGHVNAYFPLFIPMSYLAKEEQMAEGFAKECAVVTHYRLKAEKGKKLEVDPEAKLEEPLIIRPTSSGRKGTRPTPRQKKPRSKPTRWFAYTRNSPKSSRPCRYWWDRKPTA